METTKENPEALKMQRMMARWIAYKIDREILSTYKVKIRRVGGNKWVK